MVYIAVFVLFFFFFLCRFVTINVFNNLFSTGVRSFWLYCYVSEFAVWRVHWLPGWWSGEVVSALTSINEVNQRRAQLVLRWVTVSEFNSRWGTFISLCDQPPRSTQPGHPFAGRRNEYQPKGGDALRLGRIDRYGLCVGGR